MLLKLAYQLNKALLLVSIVLAGAVYYVIIYSGGCLSSAFGIAIP